MADKKISALPAATTPLAGTEVLPIVQGGVTDQVSVANLTSGRDVTVKKLNATDNIVIGTAGRGIDFSANTHAAGMTSELLNDYEEGTFTPTLSGGTTTTYTTQMGRYTKIGRQVFFQCEIEINAIGNGSTTIVLLGDLPTAAVFSTISVGLFNAVATSVTSLTGYIGAAGGNSVQFQSLAAAGTNSTANAIFQDGARVIFSGQYSV